jgi:D-alanyl-D-alanine endopeptidase (penicillin-binding protein 7)
LQPKGPFVPKYQAPSTWLRAGAILTLVAAACSAAAQSTVLVEEPLVTVLTNESLVPEPAAPVVTTAQAAQVDLADATRKASPEAARTQSGVITLEAPAPAAAQPPTPTLQASQIQGATAGRRYEGPVRHVSFGQLEGLHGTRDALALKSSVALVLDQDSAEVLFSKNTDAVLPIASITKLMTALVVIEAGLPLDETLTVSEADIDTEKFSRSRLMPGTQLSRGEMLHLALMASENRAASALGRHYPGGLPAFVDAMNRKAQALGMKDTHYVEPTGLSSQNQSSAPDLARLVDAASSHALIRDLSTSPEYRVSLGKRSVQYRNTNGLVRSKAWDIGLQKTGYIVEAGRCLVMQARMAGRRLIMVFLDSAGKYSRIGDAERVRRWIESDGKQAPAAEPTRVRHTPARASRPAARKRAQPAT